MNAKPKLLLHACCAPCVTHPVKLLQTDYEVSVFFYNPNIQPESEYRAREEEIKQLADKWDFPLIIAHYDLDDWKEEIRGFESEPEGGQRCERCYRLRLAETARIAQQNGFTHCTTTLSISPHKNAELINTIGTGIADRYGLTFVESNFKKKDGFKISCTLSEEEGLYRQDYCGCIYSRQTTK